MADTEEAQGQRAGSALLAMPVNGAVASAGMLALCIRHSTLWPVALVALIPFLVTTEKRSPFRVGKWSFLLAFAAVLGSTFWWMDVLRDFGHLSCFWSALCTVLLCGYQALPYGLWGFGCAFLARRWSVPWLVSAPLLWVVAESVWPFMFQPYLAITVAGCAPMAQLAEIGGPALVSGAVVLINVVVYELLAGAWRRQRPSSSVAIAVAVVVVALGWGYWRSETVRVSGARAKSIRVGIVQPNFGIVPPAERERNGKKYVAALREATAKLAEQGAELVLWPESSWPYLMDRTMAREYPKGHPWELRGNASVRLLCGTLSQTPGTETLFNSAVLVAQDGRIVGRYDKQELVPFGEHIPFRERFPEWAAKVRKRLPLCPEITPGENATMLVDGDLRLAVVICSEDLNTGLVREVARQKANLLVSIVSDAWFGTSAAPWQHLALARYRAIETRRSFVRCCNTGVSAYIDATGRVVSHSTLTDPSPSHPVAPELLIVDVPLLDIPTPFLKYHAYVPWACLLTLVLIVLAKERKRRREEKRAGS